MGNKLWRQSPLSKDDLLSLSSETETVKIQPKDPMTQIG